MTPEEYAALAAHNKRVRALAEVMPAEALWRAVCAIGYPADKDTGITSGKSVAKLVRMSQGKPWQIGRETLKRAIKAFETAGVLKIQHPPAIDGKRQANTLMADYEYQDRERLSEVWELGKRQRRRERERQREARNAPDAGGTDSGEAPAMTEDEAYEAAMAAYPEPPDDPAACAVCEGTHDPDAHTVEETWTCQTCRTHTDERHEAKPLPW